MLPPETSMSLAVKSTTSSENLKLKVTSSSAVPVVSSVIVSVGDCVSNVCVAVDCEVLLLPDKSLKESDLTLTPMVPVESWSGETTRLYLSS